MAKSIPSRLARLVRWGIWIVLGVALALQLRIWADGGLRLPGFAVAAMNERLAEHGLTVGAEAVWLDPRGRVLILAPRVALASSASEFATAEAVSIQLRRRALLHGRLEFLRVEITGLALSIPATHSPTGASQTLLESGEFRLDRASGSDGWHLQQSSARVLSVPTAFTGALPAVSSPGTPRAAPEQMIRAALTRAAGLYRRLADLPLDSMDSLRIELAADHLVVAAGIPSLLVPAHPVIPAALEGSTLTGVGLVLAIPFDDPDNAELRLDAARLASPPALALTAENVSVRLRAPARAALVADLAATRIQRKDTPLPPAALVASVRYVPAEHRVSGELSAGLADADWSASFDGDPAARAGAVTVAGAVTSALLDAVRGFLPEKARPIVELTDPLLLDLTATLAPGGAPGRVEVLASAGRAVAGRVAFDRAGATLVYEPGAHRLRADDLLLVQADSRAEGSYEMDTESLAFRFLLGGRLRPMAIEGWFSGWWDRFWANFAFGPTPPSAEADIQGIWREPGRTRVFVGAVSGELRLRELPLDSLATRVYVHPYAIELLGFNATRADHVASGGFARFAAGPDEWSRMTFDIRSDFPIEALPLLFPKEGPEITASFKLGGAPRIHLVGETFGPASATPGAQRYSLDIFTSAPLRYQGFPLDHLSARLERRDGEIRLDDLRVGFADGVVVGGATLSGPNDDRWLALDLALADAKLDLVLLRWKEFQAARPDYVGPTPKTDDAKDAKEEKALGGTLALTLAATGPAARPLEFAGRGSARIAGADLARIRLLGGLSGILSEIGIGLATIELTDADARFDLKRNRLVFDSLQLTGPSALVEADGAYILSGGILDFTAKVRPFEQRTGFLSSTAGLVLSPLSSVLEVELGGTLDEPDWTFSYGPTRLFRRITGSHPKPTADSPDNSSR